MPTLGVPIIFVPLLVVVVVGFTPTTGHKMVADGSVGFGSGDIGFLIAWVGSETFLA